MKENRIDTITNLFEGSEIRSVWDSEKEEYYFSVVDVISALTDSEYQKSRNYWKWLKNKLNSEGSELVSITNQLKMKSKDDKYYITDVLDTEGILRLIESVPSPKAEPFKMWLASLAKERIDEVYDPEKAIDRAIGYYREKRYSDNWIEIRLKGILNRKKLTDVWKENGITQNYEYAMLTNEIYKTWPGMKAHEYKEFKGIRKESLRDNMSDIEVILTDLGEITARDIAKKEHPKGLKENLKVAKKGGNVSKIAKESYELATGNRVITSINATQKNSENNNEELGYFMDQFDGLVYYRPEDSYRKDVLKEGIEIGLAEGEAVGLAKGKELSLANVARKMLQENVAIDLIKKYTGLTIKEINELKG